jgi:hypothetical protein
MYAIVLYPMIRNLIDLLHEGDIYELSRFGVVLLKSILRPVEAKFTLTISASVMLVRKMTMSMIFHLGCTILYVLLICLHHLKLCLLSLA